MNATGEDVPPRIVVDPAQATDIHRFYCTACGQAILISRGDAFIYCSRCGHPHAVGWSKEILDVTS